MDKVDFQTVVERLGDGVTMNIFGSNDRLGQVCVGVNEESNSILFYVDELKARELSALFDDAADAIRRSNEAKPRERYTVVEFTVLPSVAGWLVVDTMTSDTVAWYRQGAEDTATPEGFRKAYAFAQELNARA